MQPAFDNIYARAPAARREALIDFRATHPYKHFTESGTEWSYIASGQGDQAVLILGGGIATGESAWKTILRLEGRYRVISPSYPPVGKLLPVVDGLARLLEAESICKAHVYGHSLGSLVGHVFIRQYPEKVDKLILGSFGLYTRGHTLLARLFFKLPYPLLRRYYERAVQRLTAGAADEEQAFQAAYMKDLFYLQHTPQSFMCQMSLLIDAFDHASQYGIFSRVSRRGRVLIIVAEDDRGFSPSERAMLVATYSGARVKRFESGGHWVGLTHGDEYNAVVESFLGQGSG